MRLRMPAVSTRSRISGTEIIGARAEPALDVAARRLRVRIQQFLGRLHRFLHERSLAEIGVTEKHIPALALAEIIAGPAYLQVLFGDAEAVFRLEDHLE